MYVEWIYSWCKNISWVCQSWSLASQIYLWRTIKRKSFDISCLWFSFKFWRRRFLLEKKSHGIDLFIRLVHMECLCWSEVLTRMDPRYTRRILRARWCSLEPRGLDLQMKEFKAYWKSTTLQTWLWKMRKNWPWSAWKMWWKTRYLLTTLSWQWFRQPHADIQWEERNTLEK